MRPVPALRLGAAVLLSVLGSACLVTDKPVFGEPNTPASLVPTLPKATLKRAPTDADAVCSTANRYMAFQAEVRDANIADTLVARLFINSVYRYEQVIPSNNQIARNPLTICVKESDISGACTHVELIVANKFEGPDRPDSMGEDFAVTEWWVLAPANVNPMADPDSCLRLIDGGI